MCVGCARSRSNVSSRGVRLCRTATPAGIAVSHRAHRPSGANVRVQSCDSGYRRGRECPAGTSQREGARAAGTCAVGLVLATGRGSAVASKTLTRRRGVPHSSGGIGSRFEAHRSLSGHPNHPIHSVPAKGNCHHRYNLRAVVFFVFEKSMI